MMITRTTAETVRAASHAIPVPVVSLEGVEFSYVKHAAPVLRCAELAIPSGTVTWLSGRSGCGKSTLLRLMAGLRRPTRGSVTVGGVNLAACSEGRRADLRARTMGVVFQEHDLIDGLSVAENVQFAARLAGVRMGLDQVGHFLSLVGVADLAGRKGWEISGGQRQRAAIARALAKGPSLLLLDEPTSALDEENSESLFRLMVELGSAGVTTLVVSHDPLIADFCDGRVQVVDGVAGGFEPRGRWAS